MQTALEEFMVHISRINLYDSKLRTHKIKRHGTIGGVDSNHGSATNYLDRLFVYFLSVYENNRIGR